MRHLIVFSHLRWSFVYQRPQHLLTRLAKHYEVVYVEEPIRFSGASHVEVQQHAPDVRVLVPRTPVDAVGFHDDQLSVVGPLIRDYLADHSIEDYAVWLYTPMALPLLAELQPRAVVYDCMDELSAFKDAPRQLRQREAALMKMSDVVLTGGPALYESKQNLHDNVHCLPSAVDAAHFAPERLDGGPGDERNASATLHSGIGTPRLGFYGVIDERMDLALLAAVAEARPHWQLVIAGPVVKIDPNLLPRRSNIHWLGMQSYERLPHLSASWDVCLLPFALNDSTRFISPTKTLEYMAAGKPIVSTAVRDVALLYGDVVRIASDAASFIEACEAALAEKPSEREERLARMDATVARYSWDKTAELVRTLVDTAYRPVPPASAIVVKPAPFEAKVLAPVVRFGT